MADRWLPCRAQEARTRRVRLIVRPLRQRLYSSIAEKGENWTKPGENVHRPQNATQQILTRTHSLSGHPPGLDQETEQQD